MIRTHETCPATVSVSTGRPVRGVIAKGLRDVRHLDIPPEAKFVDHRIDLFPRISLRPRAGRIHSALRAHRCCEVSPVEVLCPCRAASPPPAAAARFGTMRKGLLRLSLHLIGKRTSRD
jgi:hypothetical protein